MENLKRISLVIGGATAMLATAVVFSPAAYASLACEAYTIQINENSGGEPPSFRQGHDHFSGSHYVRSIGSNRVWNWWADNNAGVDGDTADTPYGLKQC